MTKSAENYDLVTFTEEILNGKLHFLDSEQRHYSQDRKVVGLNSTRRLFVPYGSALLWGNRWSLGQTSNKNVEVTSNE